MKRNGYTARSIEIPDWMNAVLVDIAVSHKRSVNAEIQCVIESWLEGTGFVIPEKKQYGLTESPPDKRTA
jgi:hypothetical protein